METTTAAPPSTMDITINTQILAQELKILDKMVSSKPTIPVLGNVLLRADDALYLSALDTEVGLSTTCSAWVVGKGTITLPAKKFLAIIDQMPDADVRITQEGSVVHLSCGSFKSRLQTLPAHDFPAMPVIEGTKVEVPAQMFQSLIDKTRYAISDKGERLELSGALLTMLEGNLSMVTTDGKRLAVARITGGFDGEPVSALVPAKTLDIINSLHTDKAIEFSRGERLLFFKMGERVMFSRQVDGRFPAWERIVPKDHDKTVTVSRAALAAALKRVGLVADETQHAMDLMFTNGSVTIRSSSAQVGDADETVSTVYEGEDIKITVNWKMLLQFLEAAVGKSITIQLKTPLLPLLLSDGENFLNVLTAIR